jgi:Protein of unknown function (DUF2934)
MNTKPIPDPSEEEIQKQAYLLYLASGSVPGRDVENWLAAKELLKHRHGKSGGRSRKPKKTTEIHFPPSAEAQRSSAHPYPLHQHN